MRKITRRSFLTAAVACGAAAALSACGGSSSASSAAASSTVASASVAAASNGEKFTVGICQLVQHAALDAATQGFEDALTASFGENVTFDFQNAQGDSATCATITNGFVSAGVDLIMANATQAVISSATATSDIPIVGTSVTDYVTTGTVKSNDAPGGNVTGTSDLAPIDQQVELLQKLLPDAKNVGILYCSAEANSVYQAEQAQKYLEKAGINVKTYTAADSNDIQQVVTKAADENDAIYIPTDNTIASNMEIVKNVTVPAKVPVIAGEENMCSAGGLATLSISYESIGYNAGLMAYDILVNGKNPADMPIQYADDVTLKYNADIASELGIEIPDDMVAIEKEDK